jgi:hypothetical protein
MSGPRTYRRAAGIGVPAVLGLFALIVTLFQVPASAADTLTVAQAISSQTGSSATVKGYIVGEPTATDTDDMLYVQITSSYRSAWGLQTNPDLIGDVLVVTGTLTAYFAHAGLKSPSAMTAGTSTTPTATALHSGSYGKGTSGVVGVVA